MKVSVLIPNYNYGHLISACIDSVLRQLAPGDEVIVVDDGSTDNSREVITGYGDKVTAIFQPNSGQAAAFTAAFAVAKGDIVALLDSDDVLFPGKLDALRKLYADNPEIGWVFHDLAMMKPEDTTKPEAYPVVGTLESIAVDERVVMRTGKLTYDAPATSGLTFRHSFISKIFPLPSASSIAISDHYIKFYALSAAPGLHVQSPLGGQVLHGSNLYTTHKQDAAKAKIFLNTALALRSVMPDHPRFCDEIFATGLHSARKAHVEANFVSIIDAYRKKLPRSRRLLMDAKLRVKMLLGK